MARMGWAWFGLAGGVWGGEVGPGTVTLAWFGRPGMERCVKRSKRQQVYVPVEGARLSKKVAQLVGVELEKLRVELGIITPEAVVERARPKRSPLHSLFEWNDKKAAAAHRITQARYLIRSVKVVFLDNSSDPRTRETRAFVNIERTPTHAYNGVVEVLSNAEHRDRLLTQAWRDLEAWRRKYQNLHELREVFAVLSEMKMKRNKKRRAA